MVGRGLRKAAGTMIHVYTICSSPHLYRGPVCPLDGAERPHAARVARAVAHLRAQGAAITLAALQGAGVPRSALDWLILMELGREDLAFDAVELGGMLVGGRRTSW